MQPILSHFSLPEHTNTVTHPNNDCPAEIGIEIKWANSIDFNARKKTPLFLLHNKQ